METPGSQIRPTECDQLRSLWGRMPLSISFSTPGRLGAQCSMGPVARCTFRFIPSFIHSKQPQKVSWPTFLPEVGQHQATREFRWLLILLLTISATRYSGAGSVLVKSLIAFSFVKPKLKFLTPTEMEDLI